MEKMLAFALVAAVFEVMMIFFLGKGFNDLRKQSGLEESKTFFYAALWYGVLILLAVMLVILLGRPKGQTGGKSGPTLERNLSGRKRFHGEIACLYLLGYGLGRFWIEGIRTDRLMIPGTTLAVSQVLSAVMVIVGAVCLVAGIVRNRTNTDGELDR